MNKKHMKIAAIAFTAWYVISRPEGAAHLVNGALSGLGNAAESLSQFMSAIPN
ncbi:hypothetical protein AB0C84_32835 [Actinomadura sp. NPDC048955]|uniref:Uncharacterized protein n=4 Tax=Actinomadura TaxID=1988 RepID=A0A7X0KZ66_9ACTN|nr:MULTISPECIES: hypothetical protein [Actinomadura]MBB6396153.1 hypothetical protein [Actinomadura coerulea]MCR3738935.1 hypothetical protein [Actinomadura glauciflava]NYD51094.1 hypothetical protein [Actinomadura luteofluorescens]NYE15474.1 hypothetical protein [Actinomadura citrea]SNR87430.1 hypothetical protein SAMN06265355_10819 [Actinomadura mexicana]